MPISAKGRVAPPHARGYAGLRDGHKRMISADIAPLAASSITPGQPHCASARLPSPAPLDMAWLALRPYYRNELALTSLDDGREARVPIAPRMVTDSLHALRPCPCTSCIRRSAAADGPSAQIAVGAAASAARRKRVGDAIAGS